LGCEDRKISRQPLGHDTDRKQSVDQFLVGVVHLSFVVHKASSNLGLVVFLSSLPTGKKEAHRTKNLKNIFALCHEALAEGKTVI
jgi:hypothetical protein